MKLKGKAKADFLARMAAGRAKKGKKGTKSATNKRKPEKKRSNNMAKKKTKKSSSRRNKVTGILSNPTLKKVMIGMGAASLAGTVVSMVAPQYAPIAKPLAALAVGGPIGAVAAVVADGGIGAIGNLLGGVTGQQSGGLSV